MTMDGPTLARKAADLFGASIKEVYFSFGLQTLIIETERIAQACRILKADPELRFDYLSDICGVDKLPGSPRFEVVYHLYSIPFGHRLRLKCRIDDGEEVPTVTGVWRTADWHEREAFDMYGIVFNGHPDLRRIYLWDGFEGHPLRKDFPTKGYKDELNPFGEEKSDARPGDGS